MNYFEPFPTEIPVLEEVAWESQLAISSCEPWLQRVLASRRDELFPRFVATYRELQRLPRGLRRDVQLQLSRSRTFKKVFPSCTTNGGSGLGSSRLVQSLAGIALLVALEQSLAGAAMITVTTNLANVAADGRCSLPEAIVNANNDAPTYVDCASGNGSDTIVLPARSTHQLRSSFASYYGGNGLPLITSAITIEGNGGGISRPRSQALYRLMSVTSTGDLTLNNLRLSGGIEYYGGAILNAGRLTISNATISGALAGAGGAVFNAPGHTLTIINSNLSRNASHGGGAIMNFDGELIIENSKIASNQGGNGGGILSVDGSISVRNSEISTNRAHYRGGGIYVQRTTATIEACVISGNSADDAGGVMIDSGTVSIDNSVINRNRATSRGGGVFNQQSNTIIGASEISSNLALTGAGVSAESGFLNINDSMIVRNQSRAQGGGVEITASSVDISSTTISKNRSGEFGGGISSLGGILHVDNSTISGNSARTLGGGVWIQGRSDISSSTITGNTAAKGGGLYRNLGDPIIIGTHVTIKRNLVSGNRALVSREIHNSGSNPVAILDTEFNLIGVSNDAGIGGFSIGPTDRIPSAAIANILAPLADNGGPTQTHALVTGSPAIDAVPGVLPECSGTDQRGAIRPQGFACDIGSFEK